MQFWCWTHYAGHQERCQKPPEDPLDDPQAAEWLDTVDPSVWPAMVERLRGLPDVHDDPDFEEPDLPW